MYPLSHWSRKSRLRIGGISGSHNPYVLFTSAKVPTAEGDGLQVMLNNTNQLGLVVTKANNTNPTHRSVERAARLWSHESSIVRLRLPTRSVYTVVLRSWMLFILTHFFCLIYRLEFLFTDHWPTHLARGGPGTGVK